jgi:hypothetical protein
MVAGIITPYAETALNGNEKYQAPVPYVVVDPIWSLNLTKQVLPISLYLPVKVPLFNTGSTDAAVQTGTYDVHADSICEPARLNVVADIVVALKPTLNIVLPVTVPPDNGKNNPIPL